MTKQLPLWRTEVLLQHSDVATHLRAQDYRQAPTTGLWFRQISGTENSFAHIGRFPETGQVVIVFEGEPADAT